ncbi:MAG: hypothetical protein HQM09_04280 [Candidatus Riflebacteria bacterium]|nr:hypothetical protein [Candidatus Riflebacteria bacterium]
MLVQAHQIWYYPSKKGEPFMFSHRHKGHTFWIFLVSIGLIFFMPVFFENRSEGAILQDSKEEPLSVIASTSELVLPENTPPEILLAYLEKKYIATERLCRAFLVLHPDSIC